MIALLKKIRSHKWTRDYKEGVAELKRLSSLAQAPGSAPAVNEANEFRLLAHELIRRLYVAAERPHLRLLRDHCERALEELDAKDKAQNDQGQARRENH